jgi:hypothetical protein
MHSLDDGSKRSGKYVSDMANLPSKEELISKLLFMLKYPVQSLTSVLDQIAKKSGQGVAEATKEQPQASVEQVVEKEEIQATNEEIKEETKQEPMPENTQETLPEAQQESAQEASV